MSDLYKSFYDICEEIGDIAYQLSKLPHDDDLAETLVALLKKREEILNEQQ